MAFQNRPSVHVAGDSTDGKIPLSAQVSSFGFASVMVLAVVLIVSHWHTLAHMVDRWSNDPQYSHGFLVPIFALGILWVRRDQLRRIDCKPDWRGLALLFVGLLLRIIAVQTYIESLDAVSLLPTILGLVLLVGGGSALKVCWSAIVFLAFMMPLPFFMEIALALPLRHLATVMSAYALQTFGCPAFVEGNIICIDSMRLGVADACSGLGMLMTFFALSTATAMIVSTPAWDRALLISSAVPIAILANVIRITATGLAYYHAGQDSPLAQMIYHDLAGWLMMPIAIGILWLELKIVSFLLIEDPRAAPVPLPLLQPRQPLVSM